MLEHFLLSNFEMNGESLLLSAQTEKIRILKLNES